MSTQTPLQNLSFFNCLTPERVIFSDTVISKKKALELIAQTLAKSMPQVQENDIFDSLLARERLGSTAIGRGCAIPHCRSKEVEETLGCFLKLKNPVDFESPDKDPVDLFFVIVVPQEATETHLKLLSEIAEKLHQENFLSALRKAKTNQELYWAVTHGSPVA